MSTWPTDLLILIPVYNHGTTVGTVVRDCLALDAPVLVVDDGSDDGSGAAAAEAGAELVSHERNRGKAAALLTGMQAAWTRGYRRVFSIDADGQHPVEEVPRLVARSQAEPAAIVIGRRDMRVAPRINRIGRLFSNLSVWSTCGRWPGDSQSGMRIYPLAGILSLPLRSGGYAFEVEVLPRAVWNGTPVTWVDVSVRYPADRITHFNKWRDNLQAIRSWAFLMCRRCWPGSQHPLPLPDTTGD
ncbi:MAG: glycosyltransferase family 2 protein [Planctomycetota bacterium]